MLEKMLEFFRVVTCGLAFSECVSKMKKLCLFQTVGCVVNMVSALRFVIVSICLSVRTIEWLEFNGLLNIQSAYALDMVDAAKVLYLWSNQKRY